MLFLDSFSNIPLIEQHIERPVHDGGIMGVRCQGCYDGLIAWFHKHATLLGAVGVGIASLEVCNSVSQPLNAAPNKAVHN